MNMQIIMRYFHIGPLNEKTGQIVSLMCITDYINIQLMVFLLWFGSETCLFIVFYEFTSFVRFSLIFLNMQIR